MIPPLDDKQMPPGTFHGRVPPDRVLPEISGTTSVTMKTSNGKLVTHVLTVHVNDAGDPVGGATNNSH
jgi:hypothetical protein